jgi:hypothetical protein
VKRGAAAVFWIWILGAGLAGAAPALAAEAHKSDSAPALAAEAPKSDPAGAAAVKKPDPRPAEHSEEEFDADSTTCRQAAQLKVMGPNGDGQREINVAQAVDKDGVYKVTRGLIAACMKARGYPVGN